MGKQMHIQWPAMMSPYHIITKNILIQQVGSVHDHIFTSMTDEYIYLFFKIKDT